MGVCFGAHPYTTLLSNPLKNVRMKAKNIFTILAITMAGTTLLCSCDNYLGIDDDRDDCGYDFNLTYRVNLNTNKDEEIENKLYAPADTYVRAALQKEWDNIFRAYSKDLNISFFKLPEDNLEKQENYNDFDSHEKSYMIFLDHKLYNNIAIGNAGQETAMTLTTGDNSKSVRLQVNGATAMQNQYVGVFTGRERLEAGLTEKNNHIVNLYQVNCAAALVLDTLDAQINSARIEVQGMAEAFNVADSTFIFKDDAIVEGRQISVSGADNHRLCYYTLNFPSHDQAQKEGDPVWRMNVYVSLPDGTTTKNELSVYARLRAGFCKIIKARALPNGALEITDTDVGASFKLDWNPGSEFNPSL